jgi:predicted S18 family serine protease
VISLAGAIFCISLFYVNPFKERAMKTILASVAFLAFAAAPAFADCSSKTTAMSKKPVVQQTAAATQEMFKFAEGMRIART